VSTKADRGAVADCERESESDELDGVSLRLEFSLQKPEPTQESIMK
jgi:hypothetical protein